MLSSTVFKIRDNIKLLAYGSKIGILEPIKKLVAGNKQNTSKTAEIEKPIVNKTTSSVSKAQEYLENFKSLVDLYGFDKSKTTLLLDSRKTSASFLTYCKENNYKYLDFAPSFEVSEKPVTLIYDWHWNNHGRELIAKTIADHIKSKSRKQFNSFIQAFLFSHEKTINYKYRKTYINLANQPNNYWCLLSRVI